MTTTQERIKRDIVEELAWDARVLATDVKVDVTDGSVTESGRSRSLGGWSRRLTGLSVQGTRNMQVELTAKQLQVLMTLTDEWLRAASPESRQAEAEAPPIDLEIDLTGLQELRDCLRDQAQRAAEAEAWHGYVEARRVPCNPSPGSGSP